MRINPNFELKDLEKYGFSIYDGSGDLLDSFILLNEMCYKIGCKKINNVIII